MPDTSTPEARLKLDRCRQPAERVALFNKRDALASLCCQACCREAVVTAADYYYVILSVHAALRPRMAFAAISPEAPMMPPPGCVPAAHIQRLRTGVLYFAQPAVGRR